MRGWTAANALLDIATESRDMESAQTYVVYKKAFEALWGGGRGECGFEAVEMAVRWQSIDPRSDFVGLVGSGGPTADPTATAISGRTDGRIPVRPVPAADATLVHQQAAQVHVVSAPVPPGPVVACNEPTPNPVLAPTTVPRAMTHPLVPAQSSTGSQPVDVTSTAATSNNATSLSSHPSVMAYNPPDAIKAHACATIIRFLDACASSPPLDPLLRQQQQPAIELLRQNCKNSEDLTKVIGQFMGLWWRGKDAKGQQEKVDHMNRNMVWCFSREGVVAAGEAVSDGGPLERPSDAVTAPAPAPIMDADEQMAEVTEGLLAISAPEDDESEDMLIDDDDDDNTPPAPVTTVPFARSSHPTSTAPTSPFAAAQERNSLPPLQTETGTERGSSFENAPPRDRVMGTQGGMATPEPTPPREQSALRRTITFEVKNEDGLESGEASQGPLQEEAMESELVDEDAELERRHRARFPHGVARGGPWSGEPMAFECVW